MATQASPASTSHDEENFDHSPSSVSASPGLPDEEKATQLRSPATEPVVTAQDWTGPDDPECPLNWSLGKKVYLTIVPSLYCFTATLASSIYIAGDPDIEQRFGIGDVTALLGFSLFIWGLAFGPIITGPLSENYGRKAVYLGTFPLFGLFVLGTGLAQNFATIAICRFFAGVFGSPALAVGGGTLADIWPPKYFGRTFPALLLSPFVGPALGPVIGGFVAAKKDFRWLNWVTLFAIVGCYIISLPMPETYKRRILQKRAKRLNLAPPPSSTPEGFMPAVRFFLIVTIAKPVRMLATEPIILCLTVYISFNFAVIYSFFSAFPYVFETVYGFDGPQVGLTFLSIAVGVVLGIIALIVVDQKTYPKLLVRYGGRVPPEYRLISACIGGFLNPISLFWFGWTADKGVPWPVPVVGAIWFGTGNMMVYAAGAEYFLDSYGSFNGASALSANGLMRYGFAGAFPLFTAQMFRGLGIGWATSLLGFVSVALVPVPFFFFKYGYRIRKRSKYIDKATPGPGMDTAATE